MPASWRLRRGRGVVTWKSAETIGTFLRRVGASSAAPRAREPPGRACDARRPQPGHQRRVGQPPAGGRGRRAASSGRSTELEADGRLAEQPPVVRLVAAARRETPEATFGELAERLGRATVQRALERIERLALPTTSCRPARARPWTPHRPRERRRRSGSARCDSGVRPVPDHRRQLEDAHDTGRCRALAATIAAPDRGRAVGRCG